MFTDEQIKRAIMTWVESAGRNCVVSALVAKNVSTTTSNDLTAGRYKSELKGATKAVIVDELIHQGLLHNQTQVS